MNDLSTPFGDFSLARYPERKNEQLRAWDAADAYLLHQLFEENLIDDSPAILIINDNFGALSVPLHEFRTEVMSDSFLSHCGIEGNLHRNGLSVDAVKLLTSLDSFDKIFDLVLIKIPKTLALLEDQLHRIRPHLSKNCRIIGAGMSKGIHTSTLQLFETLIGPTKTSLARQKARLVFSSFDPELSPGESPYPTCYRMENSEYQICNHANVFSREKLDIGTRLFLEQIPHSGENLRIVDLGCGNGVVGLIAADKNPQAELVFVDESFMAVASAETNFRNAFGASRKAEFRATNCLDGIAPGSVDLILNNPPFHQQSAVGDQVAWEMFRGSRDTLKRGGKLLVIGNRHLGYHTKLKRLFGNCRVASSNRKFVVLEAIKKA